MELLTPSCKFPYKEDSFENSPSTIPITVNSASPLEIPRQLSPTSIPLPPSPTTLEPMDTYEGFHLAKNSNNISEILDLLEPNKLLLRTWSYFQHCQQTAQKLEKEACFQKDLADSLLGDLRILKIDEILQPIIIKARREKQRLTRFARPPSSICIVTPSNMSAIRPNNLMPDTSSSTFAGGSISSLSHAGGPS